MTNQFQLWFSMVLSLVSTLLLYRGGYSLRLGVFSLKYILVLMNLCYF